ncbi:palmitoyltransferase ZDHHC11-like [Oscarella lobularis]|uniref:palmitoyltransferase ZDHHC11-like n=1 Tax=Oscarella lobularis TaxID=121494 RepID=UPI003314271A
MVRCCSDEPPATGDNSFLRHNGWSLPLNPFQCIAWSIILIFLVVHFGLLSPYVPEPLRTLEYVISSIVALVHVVFLLVATTVDPGDANVRKLGADRPTAVFDRSVRSHVVEEQHCCLCVVEVDASSKHCRACNKCVFEFDHHCKWLNNCVGGRNYRFFIATLVSGIFTIIQMLVVSCYVFSQYFANKDNLKYLEKTDSAMYMFGAEAPGAALVTVAIVHTILLFITLGLISHLFFFHVYLMTKDMSTYEYIVEAEENASKWSDLEEGRMPAAKSGCKKNKVVPAPDDVKPSFPKEPKLAFVQERLPEFDLDSNGDKQVIPIPNTTTADCESLKEIPISEIHVPRSEDNAAAKNPSAAQLRRLKEKQSFDGSVKSFASFGSGRRVLPPLVIDRSFQQQPPPPPPLPVVKGSNGINVNHQIDSKTLYS